MSVRLLHPSSWVVVGEAHGGIVRRKKHLALLGVNARSRARCGRTPERTVAVDASSASMLFGKDDRRHRFVESACARFRRPIQRAFMSHSGPVGERPVVTDAVRLQGDLARFDYLADEGLADGTRCGSRRPLLLEGEAGVGKTEVAKCWARCSALSACAAAVYEGIDVPGGLRSGITRASSSTSRADTGGPEALAATEDESFTERFLVRRPLLRALDQRDAAARLLIDEMIAPTRSSRRSLLEILSDFP